MSNRIFVRLTDEIARVLSEYNISVYYLKDRKRLITVLDRALSRDEAVMLLGVRQRLSSKNRAYDPILKLECAFLTLSSLNDGSYDRAVYLGERSERITDRYRLSALVRAELIEKGELLFGEDVKNKIARPSSEEISEDIEALVRRIESGRVRLDDSETLKEMSGYLSLIERGDTDGVYKMTPLAQKERLIKKNKMLRVKNYG